MEGGNHGGGLQAKLDAILSRRDARGAVRGVSFSPFRTNDVKRSAELVARLTEVAEREGLERALTVAEEAAATEPAGVVKHAVKLFVTHYPPAARELRVPTVEASATRAAEDATVLAAAHPTLPAPNPLTQPARERALDWYRQDPFANDHHHHWHLVYPTSGVLVSHTPVRFRTQPRQGELFFYMHQQMLARYDTERVVAGLPPVAPFAPSYSEPIPQGYGLTGYITRPAGAVLRDLDGGPTLGELRRAHTELETAVSSGHLSTNAGRALPVDESLLGAATEESEFFRSGAHDAVALMGDHRNFHGNGHVLVACVRNDPRPEAQRWFGVMLHTESAICDPFFYRWHRHIDNLYAEYQDAAPPNDFSEHSANVRFVKSDSGRRDIAFCFTRQIPGSEDAAFDFAAWGRANLGKDLAGAPPAVTDQLVTRFVESAISLPHTNEFWTQPGLLEDVVHLEHEPFVLFLRVENPLPARQNVTVRFFLCHAAHAEDRRMWIELDKFRATLEPGVNLVAQPDARSSVIKRKGLEAPGAEGRPEWDPVAYCDCGWPYTLLLPSGASTPAGTPFVLMAALTDWNWDRANDEAHTCGSMSFCGAQDKYPDKQKMGFPFNRRFPQGIAAAIDATPSMVSRALTIRCENPAPGRA